MEVLKVGPFEVRVTNSNFTIERGDGSVSMIPGEGASAVNVILHSVTMESMKVLPEKISHTPFEVRFTPERVLYLARKDRTRETVAFKFDEGDSLVEAIKQGASKLKDIGTIQSAPGGGVSHYQKGDTIVEGR